MHHSIPSIGLRSISRFRRFYKIAQYYVITNVMCEYFGKLSLASVCKWHHLEDGLCKWRHLEDGLFIKGL